MFTHPEHCLLYNSSEQHAKLEEEKTTVNIIMSTNELEGEKN